MRGARRGAKSGLARTIAIASLARLKDGLPALRSLGRSGGRSGGVSGGGSGGGSSHHSIVRLALHASHRLELRRGGPPEVNPVPQLAQLLAALVVHRARLERGELVAKPGVQVGLESIFAHAQQDAAVGIAGRDWWGGREQGGRGEIWGSARTGTKSWARQ